MATSLELTLISATISSDVKLDPEPKDFYATVRCAKEQRCTRTAHDQGRLPVWNESFTFSLEDRDLLKFIFVQVFTVGSEQDELLGVARIPMPTTSGEMEGSLHVLVSPKKGQTGHLKAAWRWKPTIEIRASEGGPIPYPLQERAPYDDLTGAMEKLAVHKDADSGQYSSPQYGAAPYPPGSVSLRPTTNYSSYSDEHAREMKSQPYPPPLDSAKTSYPPAVSEYPSITDACPAYPNYQGPVSAEESQLSSERGRDLSQSTSRGFGDTKDKGHHSHMPYGYPPPPLYGVGYPPPSLGYPPLYGAPPTGYPPGPAYPPAPQGYPPPPHGYPPAVNSYPSQPYPHHGYPLPAYGTHAPYPAYPGGYAPGAYVGHSSSWKPPKHHKHHKMPKHFKHHYGHIQPPFMSHGHHHHHHYKHKKHKGFGKGYKFKKFKGFKGFKKFKF